jgi:HEPN domain-containing protein
MEKARNDLKVVEHLIDMEDAPTDMLLFHCQQAIEKYLKAYLTWCDIRMRKTHDLETILNLCIEEDKKFGILKKERLSKLTIYATAIRYPEETIESTMDDVKKFYQVAEKVKKFVVKRLKKKGYKDIL